eukprot:scaffold186692_cov36-Prasinocladus_malaysianus.AAC.1
MHTIKRPHGKEFGADHPCALRGRAFAARNTVAGPGPPPAVTAHKTCRTSTNGQASPGVIGSPGAQAE